MGYYSYWLKRKEPAFNGSRSRTLTLGMALLATFLLGSTDGEFQTPKEPKLRHPRPYPSRPIPTDEKATLLPPPPINDEFFPCNDCHEGEPADPRKRGLSEHEAIKLAHGDLWCLDCHQSDQRDLLHLSDASPVKMEESWRLCTRCHANKIPEWRAGLHGKRIGSWSGPKEYFTCVVCHDPHAPLFKPLAPKPPPIPAKGIKLRGLIHPEEVPYEEQQ